MEIYSKASKGLGLVDTSFLHKGIPPQKIMPSKMEVASQHWTDWTDSTVEKIEINRKI